MLSGIEQESRLGNRTKSRSWQMSIEKDDRETVR